MEPASPAASTVSRRRYSPPATLPASSTSQEMGSSNGPEAEGAMPGGFPCPDVGRASQEADIESARMPWKRKADDKGFQHPNAKKPNPLEESSEELHPSPTRWQDFGWERPGMSPLSF
jgi:hypothetical protein